MPTKRRGSLSPGESMQRSEDLSTAAETLLPAGIFIPPTGGSAWLQCPEDPQTNFSQPLFLFLGNPYRIRREGVTKHPLAIAHMACVRCLPWKRSWMCTAINVKSQYGKGWSIVGLCVSKREGTTISEPQKQICKDAIRKYQIW